MKRRTLIVSILLHALLLAAVYVFQSMIFPYIRLNGLVPLLIPIVSTGVAVYEGRYIGGIFGLFSGILCDVSFNEPAAMFTVLLPICGLLVGALADAVITRGFATYFICCTAVLIVSVLVQMFPLAYFEDVLIRSMIGTALWQTVYSLLFVLPIWFFVRALGKRAQRVSPSGRPL